MVMMTNDSSRDLRRELETIERQLMNLTAKPQDQTARPTARSPPDQTVRPQDQTAKPGSVTIAPSRSPVAPKTLSKQAFLAAQQTNKRNDFLVDLISHPPKFSPARRSRFTDFSDSPDDANVAEEALTSRPSSGLAFFREGRGRQPASRSPSTWHSNYQPLKHKPLSPITQAESIAQSDIEQEEEEDDDNATPTKTPHSQVRQSEIIRCCEMQLEEEKRKLSREFEVALDEVARALDQAQRKRESDRESFMDNQEKMEKQLRDLKAEACQLNESLRRSTQETSALRVRLDDREKEITNLERNLAKLESRSTNYQNKQDEMQLINTSLRNENADLLSKLNQLDRQLQAAQKQTNAAEMANQELMNRMTNDAESLGSVNLDLQKTQDECQRLHKELQNLQQQKKRLESNLSEQAGVIDRIQNRCQDRDRACRLLEDRLRQCQSDLECALKEKEYLEVTSMDLANKQADVLRLRNRLEEAEENQLNLTRELQCLQHEKSTAMSMVGKLKQDLKMREEEKAASEENMERLKREVQELKRSLARQSRCQEKSSVDLVDNQGRPIPKLASSNVRSASVRPYWWHSNCGEGEGPRTMPMSSMAMKNMEFDFLTSKDSAVRRTSHCRDISVPLTNGRLRTLTTSDASLPSRRNTGTEIRNTGIELLTAEKRDLEQELHKIPKNPALRTSEQREDYQKLQKEIEALEQDIQRATLTNIY